jgi:uncharacterized membrane protein
MKDFKKYTKITCIISFFSMFFYMIYLIFESNNLELDEIFAEKSHITFGMIVCLAVLKWAVKK